MKLYVMRHGHADSFPDAAGQRSLTPQGRKELGKFAAFLRAQDFAVTQILHSEKMRARQTAEVMLAALPTQLNLQTRPWLNPDRDLAELIMNVEQEQTDSLLIGHMPLVSELVGELVAKNARRDLVFFSPGTLICLERYNADGWMISWVLRPEFIV